MRDILFIAVVVGCSLIAVVRPVFGTLAFVGLSFLNPDSMTWDIGRTFRFALFTALGTIVGYFFWHEPKRFPRQREATLLLALWGMFGISTLFAISTERAVEFFIHVSKIFLMVFLSTLLITTEQRLHVLMRVIALSLGFYGVKGGMFAIMTGGNYLVYGPVGSFLEANNSIGLALVMNLPLLFYLMKMETHRWLRWIMGGVLVLSYPAVVFTYSRGAWLGLALVTALIILKSKWKLPIIAAVGILLMLILPFLPQVFPQRLVDRYETLSDYEEESSAQSRLWNWEFCARVGLAHPLAGGGFDFYSREAYAKYFPEFLDRWPGKVWSCHSMWLTILGEHGFPGLILWVALIGSSLLSVRYIRSQGKAHTEMLWAIHYADLLQMALLAFMVVGIFLDTAYFDMFYQLVAVIIIIKERVRHAATPAAPLVRGAGVASFSPRIPSSTRLGGGGGKRDGGVAAPGRAGEGGRRGIIP